MLRWRLFLSAVLIPAFAAAFWLDSVLGPQAWVLLAVCLVLAGRCAWEFVSLVRARNFAPSVWLAILGSLVVTASGWTLHVLPRPVHDPLSALGAVTAAFAAMVMAVFFKGCLAYRSPGRTVETVSCEILIIAYVGILTAVTVQLRWIADGQAGYLALGSLLVGTKCGDTGAYTLGRLFGRRKMVPLLSPGKTWMGGLGALVGGGLGTWAWLAWTTPLFNPQWEPPAAHWAILFGVVLGAVGLIGDLAESLIKRDVGRKDASPLFPGFGGLLDLLDSILYAGPVALALWYVLPLV
ncbi:MAG: phosphatidate cytidylyltransferase [Planctomycetes bacterium]|nr:phosphatidate cytidylyltransferase [Planctomycetota bacterium]